WGCRPRVASSTSSAATSRCAVSPTAEARSPSTSRKPRARSLLPPRQQRAKDPVSRRTTPGNSVTVREITCTYCSQIGHPVRRYSRFVGLVYHIVLLLAVLRCSGFSSLLLCRWLGSRRFDDPQWEVE